MTTMDQINDISNRYYAKGETVTQISRTVKLDRKTVRKYVEKEDWNKSLPRQKKEKPLCPKLDEFKPVINQSLEDDKNAKRKQRHTA